MKKRNSLTLLLVVTIILAVFTAGFEYPVNAETFTFYFGISLIGYIAAASLSLILAFLPHLIGKLYSEKDLKSYGAKVIFIAIALFMLIGYAVYSIGYGLFNISIVILLFSLNVIVSSVYYHLKKKYSPQIMYDSRKSLLPKLKKKQLEVSEDIKKVEEDAEKEGKEKVKSHLESINNKIIQQSGEHDDLCRRHKQILEEFKNLNDGLHGIISSAYHSFYSQN